MEEVLARRDSGGRRDDDERADRDAEEVVERRLDALREDDPLLDRTLQPLPRFRDVDADEDIRDDGADEEGNREQEDVLLKRPMRLLAGDPDDLDLLSRTVVRLGGYAEGLFDFHDFGFDKNSLRDHISSVHATLKRLKDVSPPGGLPLRPPNIPPGAFWEDQGEVWNYLQSLRFAAGATMVTEQYSAFMTPENVQRSMTAKIFRECVIGILDDLID